MKKCDRCGHSFEPSSELRGRYLEFCKVCWDWSHAECLLRDIVQACENVLPIIEDFCLSDDPRDSYDGERHDDFKSTFHAIKEYLDENDKLRKDKGPIGRYDFEQMKTNPKLTSVNLAHACNRLIKGNIFLTKTSKSIHSDKCAAVYAAYPSIVCKYFDTKHDGDIFVEAWNTKDCNCEF